MHQNKLKYHTSILINVSIAIATIHSYVLFFINEKYGILIVIVVSIIKLMAIINNLK